MKIKDSKKSRGKYQLERSTITSNHKLSIEHKIINHSVIESIMQTKDINLFQISSFGCNFFKFLNYHFCYYSISLQHIFY